MMRYGENPLAVTQRVKEKIQELQPALPKGVRIVPAYDRTRLINGSVSTLTHAMKEEIIIAAVAVFLASDAARYINGANIPVDGGVTKALVALMPIESANGELTTTAAQLGLK